MESNSGIFHMKGHYRTNDSLYLFGNNITKEQLLDSLLFFVKVVVEYVFGMYMGYIIGWLMGLFVGNSYIEHYEPVYLYDLSQLSYWRLLPYEFARTIAIIGSIIGVITLMIINNKLLNQRVVSLYKNGRTNPNDIAQLLGKNVEHIEKKINKLVKEKNIIQ